MVILSLPKRDIEHLQLFLSQLLPILIILYSFSRSQRKSVAASPNLNTAAADGQSEC